MLLADSAVIDGLYIPRTNDSLYHARRILDAAVGSRGFYEFDERLHVPDGAWVSWPWAYDYLMANIACSRLWLDPALDPMALVFYVPVAWILVNAALFLAVVVRFACRPRCSWLAMLCFALSPLTQLLHSVGMLDHHYVEHTFVLLSVWLGMRWFENLASPAAPSPSRRRSVSHRHFTTACSYSSCCRSARYSRCGFAAARSRALSLVAFAIALLVATQLVLLPSEPYRQGMFEFGLLSWFHFYVAACTAATVAFFGCTRFSRALNLALFFALMRGTAGPLGAQLVSGAGFLVGDRSRSSIKSSEAQSPYTLFTEMFGPTDDGELTTAGWWLRRLC